MTPFSCVYIAMKNNSVIKSHVKGTLFALVATLGAVLLFAFAINIFGLSGGVIMPITQIIKVSSIFLGVYVAIKSVEKHAWAHGAVLGLLYTVLAFFIFSFIDKSFSLTSGLLVEALFAIAVGGISALLIRFRKKDF